MPLTPYRALTAGSSKALEVDVMPCSLEAVCHWSFGSEVMLITVSLSRYDSDTALGSGSD